MSRPLKLILAAVLFAGTGALTDVLAGTWLTKTFLGVAPAVLPFAILAAILCVRPVLRMPLVAILICAVWAGAFWLAVALDRGDSYLNMFAAGLVGGLGVAAATAIGCRRLIHLRSVCLLAAAGTLAAAPFHWRVLPQDDAAMICAFVIWQCAVGTLLYALSER
jgi:predicted neutral ceramidase superfamily lipid hydrolase